jgi:hypothetical protein
MEQMAEALPSTVMVTGNETLELARGVYVAPLTRAAVGAVVVNVIVWSSLML